MPPWIAQLNVVLECRRLRWGLWQCPPFLFLVMGLVTIVSMVATYLFASRSIEEPEIAALIVIAVTALFLVVGNLIITGFNRIAEANRMKSEFISIVSHQLRSPLSIFKWTLDVMEREIKRDGRPEVAENSMRTLRQTTENMVLIVNSLLDISRIEARTFVLKEDRFSLAQLTRRALESFREYAGASHIEIRFSAPAALPEAWGDRERVAMVVENLIDNAIRYTPGSGRIIITIAREGSFLRWTIADQGVGIPAESQPHIFEKFFRGRNVTGRKTRGSGVGLYIAKAIVEASGGSIGFTSHEGRGSTFWFTLPIERSEKIPEIRSGAIKN